MQLCNCEIIAFLFFLFNRSMEARHITLLVNMWELTEKDQQKLLIIKLILCGCYCKLLPVKLITCCIYSSAIQVLFCVSERNGLDRMASVKFALTHSL